MPCTNAAPWKKGDVFQDLVQEPPPPLENTPINKTFVDTKPPNIMSFIVKTRQTLCKKTPL
eukprot:6486262-Amphidinium_carterae.1